MALLDIMEFETMPSFSGPDAQLWEEPAPVVQQVTISGASARSAVFNPKTRFIAITADSAFRYRVGDSTVSAATTNFRIPAGVVLSFAVQKSTYIAAITTT